MLGLRVESQASLLHENIVCGPHLFLVVGHNWLRSVHQPGSSSADFWVSVLHRQTLRVTWFRLQCCQMILVQKRQKFDQTTRFWRQIFQNFVQKAPNFKPKIAKTKLHFIAFLCHFEAKIHEKINFSLKKNHQEIIGLTNSEKKKNHFFANHSPNVFYPLIFLYISIPVSKNLWKQ